MFARETIGGRIGHWKPTGFLSGGGFAFYMAHATSVGGWQARPWALMTFHQNLIRIETEPVIQKGNSMKGISCPICATNAQSTDDPLVPGIVCPRCGKFRYEPKNWSGPKNVWDKVGLSGWVRDQNDADSRPHFTRELAQLIKAKPTPGLKERSQRLLKYLATKKTRPTAFFIHEEVNRDREMLARTYSADAEDALPLMMLLREEKFIGNEDGAPGSFQLSIGGIVEVERLASTIRPYAQAFVAMSFSDAMKQTWAKGFEPAIRLAGFRPFRIDAKDYTGGISDETKEWRLFRSEIRYGADAAPDTYVQSWVFR
jgi:hypothetical protein